MQTRRKVILIEVVMSYIPKYLALLLLFSIFITELWACGVVVSMFDFHRSDRGSNPGRGGEFS